MYVYINANKCKDGLFPQLEEGMRSKLTVALAIGMALLLGWQHLHGGVPAHHLLARDDLPAISNWWGLVSLPALGWFLLGRIERRRQDPSEDSGRIVAGFAGALLYGGVLAGCFVAGRPEISDYMAQGVFLIALLYPVYRAECVLGFVIGMNFFLGAILPMIAALVFAAVGALLYHGVRFLWARMAALAR
jgi:hypothetical protein